MIKVQTSLIISVVFHTFFLFYKKDSIAPKIKIKKVTKIKIKDTTVKAPPQKSSSSEKKLKSTFSLRDLAIKDFKKKEISSYLVGTIKSLDLQKNDIFFNQFDKYLKYSPELVENKIQGNVSMTFFLDNNLKYAPSKLKLKSNSPYLKVVIVNSLNKTLKTLKISKRFTISKLTKFTIKARFSLSTSRKNLLNSQIYEDQYFFYRQKYGVSSTKDNINHVMNKALIHATNWLSLLEYLPDKEKTKVQKNWKLKQYERNPIFYK